MKYLNLKNLKSILELMNTAGKRDLCDIIRYFCDQSTEEEKSLLASIACQLRDKYYGDKVFFRGLIEISSHCKNDCYYCGLQRSNPDAIRYRLSATEILDCCKKGYSLGFRTFVLQGGEDNYYTDLMLCRIISKIKETFPDCAITLSVGERSYDSYKQLFNAGVDRYLLRHETADVLHYGQLHPSELSMHNRKRCLYDLKKIGYQVGAGFMVDSPYQTYETLAEDFLFIRGLTPHMIGIGPFIPHKDTRFARFNNPKSDHTLIILSLVRIMLPRVLLPATTALVTIDDRGREKGFMSGANVVMPNLTPINHRPDYSLYDNKLSQGCEAAEHLPELCHQIKSMGLTPDFSRGDHVALQNGGEL